MNEKEEKIKRAIGIINYIKIKPAINKANNENKKIYHVTKKNRIIENKKIIEETYPNIKIMTEIEWLTHCYQKLSPEEREKVDKKIIAEIERKQKQK